VGSEAPRDWLGLAGKTVLVAGLANKKSVAWHVGKRLEEAGARPIYSVHTEKRRADVGKLLGEERRGDVLVCDVEKQSEIDALASELARRGVRLDGLVHSIAFASYSQGPRPFHETARADFLRALDVSCFSLAALSNALQDVFAPQASVVAISISSTRMAAENYGAMAPVKAALDSSIVFLAKSFAEAGVRFNAVGAGPLKTASSAGIPGYLESYLYAEAATLRKRALETGEVADAVLYLLSSRSSGFNAQTLVMDAGMGVNWFDKGLVERAMREGADAARGD
jgi:enoyl-[acyl-carrier protein] reductase I